MSDEMLRISALASSDVGELLTLQRAAYVSEARIYQDTELPALVQTLEELRDEVTSSTGLKACAGDRMVGAVRARVDADVLHVGRLTVAPDWQGKGVGSKLLAAIETATPAAEASLFTGHLSAANLKMYARRGYVEVRREPLHPGVTLVHMAKQLRPGT